ncbi:MAG: dimethylarginine dimethylaminohydrolase family protein [Chloroflexia bacterium]
MNAGAPLPAAYGGSGWSPRTTSLHEEMGTIWGDFRVSSEWGRLEAVLLHRPGVEVEGLAEHDRALMLEPLDPQAMRREHRELERAYRQAGVEVHFLDPDGPVPPNTMFCRDLFFMTPEGAILARPASTVRAGEERAVAQKLAALGIPILLSVHGRGTFEGADALWVDERTVILATGLRTNAEGAAQVEGVLRSLGIEVIRVGLAHGSMHLLGVLNFAGPDLAVAWPWRVPQEAVDALQRRGFRVLFPPEEEELRVRMALNFVPLEPYRILMPADCPRARELYEAAGIACVELEIGALRRAAGGMGCLTGILRRA